MALWLWAFAALAGNVGLVSSICIPAHTCMQLHFRRTRFPFLATADSFMYMVPTSLQIFMQEHLKTIFNKSIDLKTWWFNPFSKSLLLGIIASRGKPWMHEAWGEGHVWSRLWQKRHRAEKVVSTNSILRWLGQGKRAEIKKACLKYANCLFLKITIKSQNHAHLL